MAQSQTAASATRLTDDVLTAEELAEELDEEAEAGRYESNGQPYVRLHDPVSVFNSDLSEYGWKIRGVVSGQVTLIEADR